MELFDLLTVAGALVFGTIALALLRLARDDDDTSI